MNKGRSLYGVEVQILGDERFWGSIILSEDFSEEHITRRVANVFKSKGFFLKTLSSDIDSVKSMAGFAAMFFTGKVQRVEDGKSEMYEMHLTYVMLLE